VIFYALVIRRTGGGLQGRHVLALLVVLPVLAGEALYRNRERIRADWLQLLSVAIPLAVAVMQVSAWFLNAKRYAVGASGPTWFLDRAGWAPPAGWWLWLALAATGGACLAALPLTVRSQRPHPRHRSEELVASPG
jgi:hypothetical protein